MGTYPKALATLLFGMLSLPLLADTTFRARTMGRQDVTLGVGQCDIRLVVDDEAEVSLTGDSVHLDTIRGREGRDAGSECNMPMPRGIVDGFHFQVMDGRGRVALLSAPSPRSPQAIVRIRDSEGGEDRYHFRVTWIDRGYNSNQGFDGRYGRPNNGYPGRGYEQGLRLSPDDVRDMCTNAARNRIMRDYRFNSVDILNARFDNRQSAWNDTIVGNAVARRGWSAQQFRFNCHLDLNRGIVDRLDVGQR